MGLRSFLRGFSEIGKKAEVWGPVAHTPQPIQSERGSREYGAAAALIPKQWNHIYGEHNATLLRFLASKEPTCYTAIKKVITEKNRRGWQWVEKYAAICPKCGKKYPTLPENKPTSPGGTTPPPLGGAAAQPQADAPPQAAPPPTQQPTGQPPPGDRPPLGQEQTPEGQDIGEDIYYCDEPDCGEELRVPDPETYEEAEELLLHPIRTDRSVSFNVLQNVHDWDVLTLGNGYMIAVLEYHIARDGGIIENSDIVIEGKTFATKPVGLMYVPDEFIIKVEDDFGNKGGKYWVCLRCRDTIKDYRPVLGDVYTKKMPTTGCPHCGGKVLYDVHLIVSSHGMTEGDGVRYYIAGEYHWTPFFPTSLRFSFAPVETLSDLLMIKVYGYRYWQNIYRTQQSNNVLKWVTSSSFNAFKEFVAFVKKSFEKKEEAWVWASAEAKGAPAGAIKLDYNAEELQAVQMAETLDNAISVLYGVMPKERGSEAGAVGLGNTSGDMSISASNIEYYQDVTNEGLFRWYVGLWTKVKPELEDWELRQIPPQPEDLNKEAEHISKVLEYTEKALQLGFTCKRREGVEGFEIEITGQPKSPEEMQAGQNPFGAMMPEEAGIGGMPPPGEEGAQPRPPMWGGPEGEGAPAKEEPDWRR